MLYHSASFWCQTCASHSKCVPDAGDAFLALVFFFSSFFFSHTFLIAEQLRFPCRRIKKKRKKKKKKRKKKKKEKKKRKKKKKKKKKRRISWRS